MWLTVMFLEDIPQFCIQLIVITNSDGRGLLRFIAWVSLGFTFIAFDDVRGRRSRALYNKFSYTVKLACTTSDACRGRAEGQE